MDLQSIIERLKRGQLRGPKEDPDALAANSRKDNPPEDAQPDLREIASVAATRTGVPMTHADLERLGSLRTVDSDE